MTDPHAAETVLHGSAVALDGRGVLILGPSGSGKSGLALRLMAAGAALVSDDRTCLETGGPTGVILSAPAAIRGLIEARGVGLLRAAPGDPAPLHLIVDLGRREPDRLPPWRRQTLLGAPFPVVWGPPDHETGIGHFTAAIAQYIRHGRSA